MRNAALLAAAVLAAPLPIAAAAPRPTEVVHVVAVDPQGQLIAGFREVNLGPAEVIASDCSAAPTAVSGDIYECSPSAVNADTCWPATSGSLLCLDDPQNKLLHRVSVVGKLPPVTPVVDPEPVALQLEDGTQCRRRVGGAWGIRDDDYVPAYGCPGADYSILVGPGDDVVNRSAATWTVKIGDTGSADTHFPVPQTRAVRTAWFAGQRG